MNLDDYITGILIGVDEVGAAVLFSATQNDITISARCGMALMDHEKDVYDPKGPHGIEGWALLVLANTLNDIQKDHCKQAILGDVARAVDLLNTLRLYSTQLTSH